MKNHHKTLLNYFFQGFFQAFGSVVGTILVTAAIIYLLSLQKIDFVGITSNFVQSTLNRLNWSKVIQFKQD